MNDVQAGAAADRLPWLNDTPAQRQVARRGWKPVLALLLIGALAAAAISYFIGRSSYVAEREYPQPATVTVSVPQPLAKEPAGTPVEAEPAPAPVVVEKVIVERVVTVRSEPEQPREAAPAPQPVETAQLATVPAPDVAPVASPPIQQQAAVPVIARPAPAPPTEQLWPAAISDGASGRVARIGTFASRHKAKVAWTRVVRLYPGVRRLNAVVAPVVSRRNGQTYYRLQFGTTSQAHSEVLCQRMRIIGQSCVVVGV